MVPSAPRGAPADPWKGLWTAELPEEDVEAVVNRVGARWEALRGAKLFLTGGSGFFGGWLLSTLRLADKKYGLGADVLVLARDEERLKRHLPAGISGWSKLRIAKGDVRTFEFPRAAITHVIHAATPASAQLATRGPIEIADTAALGTRRVLEFAQQAASPDGCRVLLTSSGAVYGQQSHDVRGINESCLGGPDTVVASSSYGEAKRMAEAWCAAFATERGLDIKIARCFAFSGPRLPLDLHYAFGNFLADGLSGRPISVKGDGTAVRSYLYAADLAEWLWVILFDGKSMRPYNVGSEMEISVGDLAGAVARQFGVEARIAGVAAVGRPVERYVPSTERARVELNLSERTSIGEAIRKTSEWCQAALRSSS